jgi:hypothetical protein
VHVHLGREYFVTGTKIRPRGRGKSQKSLDLIQAAADFLESAHPTTVRGVCYRLFVDGIIPSMARNETARVSRLLKDAREDGSIPWGWIVDETREIERAPSWTDPASFVRTVRRAYRRDFWAYQPNRVEVWSEKGTVRGVLAPILEDYGVGFRVMHGFGSATSIYDVAQDGHEDHPLVALYVGDWDPSGLYMSEKDLPERLERYGDGHVDVRRIALLPSDTPTLPSFPAGDKRKDPRFRWFTEHYGARCWELDAMHPNELRSRVEDYIIGEIEPDAWGRCERAQEAEQSSLQSLLDSWTANQ